MSERTTVVRALKEDFQKVKAAFLQVPPHPDYAPQPPPGGPADPSQMPPGAPPPGGPADPSQMPPGAPPPGGPVDPSQMMGGAPPAPPEQPPAVPSEVAAIMDQVVAKMEEMSQANREREVNYDQRISRLEQQLEHERAIKEERRKVIDALVPANL